MPISINIFYVGETDSKHGLLSMNRSMNHFPLMYDLNECDLCEKKSEI